MSLTGRNSYQARKMVGKKREWNVSGEENGNSKRPRRREGMKIDRLEMKGKKFLESASNIFKMVF